MATSHCSTKVLIPAVSYVRMSDAKQEASPDQQRAEIVKLAERHGYQLIREYLDSAISGDRTEKRVAFRQMREDARQGNFKAVLCWDQDRFGRFDPIEAGYWIKPFRDAGVKLVTVGQGIVDWDTFTGRLTYFVQQEGKHAFLRDLSRNVCRGMRAAAEAGKIVIPCFGYIVQDGQLVPDPATAPIVRRIFALYLDPAASLRSIVALLNAEGVPSPGGGPWRITTLRVVLMRRKYTGAYTWGEGHSGKYHTATASGTIERVKGQPAGDADPIRLNGHHEALVSVADFEAVQAKLAENKTRTAPFSGGGDYLLSGLMRCGHCDASLIGRRYSAGPGHGFISAPLTTWAAASVAQRMKFGKVPLWMRSSASSGRSYCCRPTWKPSGRKSNGGWKWSGATQDVDAIRGKLAKLDAKSTKRLMRSWQPRQALPVRSTPGWKSSSSSGENCRP